MDTRTVDFVGIKYAMVGDSSRSTRHWFQMADLLEYSYQITKNESLKGRRRMSDLHQIQGPGDGRWQRSMLLANRKSNLIRPAAMLASMCIECLFKGVITETKKPQMTHNLKSLAEQAGFQASDEQNAALDRLTRMNQLGRYHIDNYGKGDYDVDSREIDGLLTDVCAFACPRVVDERFLHAM